jgi:hypothetical protein
LDIFDIFMTVCAVNADGAKQCAPQEIRHYQGAQLGPLSNR